LIVSPSVQPNFGLASRILRHPACPECGGPANHKRAPLDVHEVTSALGQERPKLRFRALITPYTAVAMSGRLSTLNFDPVKGFSAVPQRDRPLTWFICADEEIERDETGFIILTDLRPNRP
jgi:hypothetical protein